MHKPDLTAQLFRTLLTQREIEYPHDVVVKMFDFTALEYLRLELWELLKAALAPKTFTFQGTPATVNKITNDLDRLIDALWLRLQYKQGSEPDVSGAADFPSDPQIQEDADYRFYLYPILNTYKGRIKRLTKAETEDPYLALKRIYLHHSPEEWKKVFALWADSALKPYSMIIARNESEFLLDYEYLEKLLEVAHLFNMETEHYDEEIHYPDPLSYICRYFSDTTLEEHLTDTKEWIQAVFGDYVWNIRPPSELIWFHDESVKLIEAAYQLHHEKKALIDRHDRTYDPPLKEASGYRISPHYLSEEEEKNPWLVLEKLSGTDAGEIRALLHDWLMRALNPRPIEDYKNSIYIYHLLQKLAEALYIIAVQMSKANETTSTNSNP